MIEAVDLQVAASPYFSKRTVIQEFKPLLGIDMCITGGESGPNARPAHPDWFRAIRDQCLAAGVSYHHKQNGEWTTERQSPNPKEWGTLDLAGKYFRWTTPWNGRIGVHSENGEEVVYRVGKKAAGRLLDGRTWDEIPEVSR
jgi:protein gp37